jgi:hypothetical protein
VSLIEDLYNKITDLANLIVDQQTMIDDHSRFISSLTEQHAANRKEYKKHLAELENRFLVLEAKINMDRYKDDE